MKKFLYILAAGIIAMSFYACDQDLLNTNPTDEVASEAIFGTPFGAQTALNGIYRAMHRNSTIWSAGWTDEHPGFFSTPLVRGLMGEDHLMLGGGSGWFWWDYHYWIDGDYTNPSGRQLGTWVFFYTIIAQTNIIIAHTEQLLAVEAYRADGKRVLGQAYALRALSYTMLFEWFCQGNYPVNRLTPGVPIYTEPTTTYTRGVGRGTVAEVFVRINADFARAIELFEGATSRLHTSHLDKYSTHLWWARVHQIQENWEQALYHAEAALRRPGLTRVATMAELGQLNNRNAPSVMWAFEVIADQTGPFGPFLSHMDPEGGYGRSARQAIDSWLWNQIPETDARKRAWWSDGSDGFPHYTQIKIRYADIATMAGDGLWLRAEEAILIAAEANIRKAAPNFAAARALLAELGARRDSEYAARLAARTNAATWNTDTRGEFVTLMDEVLFQRRVELWGEGMGRLFDLRRLNLGFTRDYEGTNHPGSARISRSPGDYEFTILIPQREIDNNPAFSSADQNPR